MCLFRSAVQIVMKKVDPLSTFEGVVRCNLGRTLDTQGEIARL
jgi:hypothetical protein